MSRPALTKEQEAEIQKLNQMGQQLRVMQNQQMQVEGQKAEMVRTLDSLKNLPEGQEIFRQSGQVLFKANLEDTIKDFDDRIELMEVRVKQSTRQLEEYKKATQDLETKIRGYLNV